MTVPGNKLTEQNILNWVFDSDFKVLSMGVYGYNSDTSAVEMIKTNGGTVNVENVSGRSLSHITASAVTVVKNASGVFYDLIVNTPTANNITLYNGVDASGVVLGIVNTGSSIVPFQLSYNIPFSTGLTIQTAGTPDLTVTFK